MLSPFACKVNDTNIRETVLIQNLQRRKMRVLARLTIKPAIWIKQHTLSWLIQKCLSKHRRLWRKFKQTGVNIGTRTMVLPLVRNKLHHLASMVVIQNVCASSVDQENLCWHGIWLSQNTTEKNVFYSHKFKFSGQIQWHNLNNRWLAYSPRRLRINCLWQLRFNKDMRYVQRSVLDTL